MPSDYPDYTDLIQIIGSDIMVPIDVQGAYIMMPVDIQAQYITLDIDIAAQSVGNITIDIAAQSIGNLEVDIVAQTIGNLVIDIEAQSVGIYLKADWEVVQGTDKNLVGVSAPDDGTWTDTIDYTIPASKTFYVCQWGFGLEADYGIVARLRFKHNATTTDLAMGGGRMGGGQSLTKPIAVVAGDHIIAQVYQKSGSAQGARAHIGGYEI